MCLGSALDFFGLSTGGRCLSCRDGKYSFDGIESPLE